MFFQDAIHGQGRLDLKQRIPNFGPVVIQGNFLKGLPTDVVLLNILSSSKKIRSEYYRDKFMIGQSVFDAKWQLIWGHVEFKNGDKYAGEMFQGMPHGKGIYVWSDSGARFQGVFKEGGISDSDIGTYTF